MEELRCVLAVVRHGDRTPKQKMKMKITQARIAGPLSLRDKAERLLSHNQQQKSLQTP